MLITDIEKYEDIHATVIQNLRTLGVKHRTKKTNKKIQETRIDGQHVFKKPLQLLSLHTVKLENGSKLQVPQLVHELCSYITCSLETEGLFRKAGSTARQKEIRLILDAGCELSSEHHVIDVANVLKLFFRELPEPLIPYTYHDTFLQCLLAKKGEIVKTLLLACLLLPSLHLTTLFYFMEFLQRVVAYSKFNKMDIKNIAIVMTPTVMPIEDKVISYTTQRLSHHVQVIQLLLENAEQIGVIPPNISESLHLPKSEQDEEELKKKKKRRSGSLTRMFHGLKKMVSSKSVDDSHKQMTSATPDLLLTPCLTRSAAKKRKVMQSTGFSSKRRRELLDTLPQGSALANTPFKPGLTPVCHHPNPEEQTTPGVLAAELTVPTHADSEFVRISKTEYEEIKSRVSAIEDRISQEMYSAQATASSSHVQTVYEQTLEEVEALSSPTTEQLAKRLSRELKIRRSSEHKVIRSPSARKIGSIRRRSQEGAAKITRNQSCHIPRVTLKRGRPNTVMTGLPQPSPLKSDVGRSSSFHSHTPNSSEDTSNLEKWASAEMFFTSQSEKKQTTTVKRLSTVQNRDSLAKLRTQNAGMVLAKAKLFNELSDSGDSNKSCEQKASETRSLKRGGTFPRQNPAIRRQRALDHSADKENEAFSKNTRDDGTTKHNAKSPKRIKPIRVLRQ